jgi:hypothetical protein
MQEEMDVHVDQARKQRGIAEVDDLCTLRMIDRSADGADAVAFDQDFAGLKECARVDLEQSRGVENDGRGSRCLRGGEAGNGADGQKSKACRRFEHGYEYSNEFPASG